MKFEVIVVGACLDLVCDLLSFLLDVPFCRLLRITILESSKDLREAKVLEETRGFR